MDFQKIESERRLSKIFDAEAIATLQDDDENDWTRLNDSEAAGSFTSVDLELPKDDQEDLACSIQSCFKLRLLGEERITSRLK